MAAGDLIVQNYQFEYNGVLFGDTDGLEVVTFSPFEINDVRTNDQARPQDHGMFAGIDYYGGRTVTVQIELWGTTENALWTAITDMMTALVTQSTELPLIWQQPNIGKLRSNGRWRRRSGGAITQDFVTGYMATITTEFFATDPRLYADTLQSSVATLAATTSGLTFNATFNIVFGAGTSSTVSIVNGGTFETRPLITIAGPVDNPFLENQTTGKTLSFSGSLGAGETLEVDFLNRTVLLNGTASRYNWVITPSGWWTLIPGTNSVRLGGSTASTATATVQWRDAYM